MGLIMTHLLIHSLTHLHALKGSGFRLHDCHVVNSAHVRPGRYGQWRTVAHVRCAVQQQLGSVQPGFRPTLSGR